MDREIYQTNNLQLAAFLYASGVKFIGITQVEKRGYFNFEDKYKAEKLIQKYFSGKATINPQKLFARLNDLKDLLFSGGKL